MISIFVLSLLAWGADASFTSKDNEGPYYYTDGRQVPAAVADDSSLNSKADKSNPGDDLLGKTYNTPFNFGRGQRPGTAYDHIGSGTNWMAAISFHNNRECQGSAQAGGGALSYAPVYTNVNPSWAPIPCDIPEEGLQVDIGLESNVGAHNMACHIFNHQDTKAPYFGMTIMSDGNMKFIKNTKYNGCWCEETFDAVNGNTYDCDHLVHLKRGDNFIEEEENELYPFLEGHRYKVASDEAFFISDKETYESKEPARTGGEVKPYTSLKGPDINTCMYQCIPVLIHNNYIDPSKTSRKVKDWYVSCIPHGPRTNYPLINKVFDVYDPAYMAQMGVNPAVARPDDKPFEAPINTLPACNPNPPTPAPDASAYKSSGDFCADLKHCQDLAEEKNWEVWYNAYNRETEECYQVDCESACNDDIHCGGCPDMFTPRPTDGWCRHDEISIKGECPGAANIPRARLENGQCDTSPRSETEDITTNNVDTITTNVEGTDVNNNEETITNVEGIDVNDVINKSYV